MLRAAAIARGAGLLLQRKRPLAPPRSRAWLASKASKGQAGSEAQEDRSENEGREASSSRSSTSKSASQSGSSDSQNEGHQQQSQGFSFREFADELQSQFGVKTARERLSGPAMSLRERLAIVRESTSKRIQGAFAEDDRTWEEALRAVFGMRVPRKGRSSANRSKEAGSDDEEEWFEAIDKESGDVYYYNTEGETVWEKPENARIIRDAEHEAHEFMEHEKTEPSFFEKQIAEKSQQISELEEKRDAAMAESNMDEFKSLNSKIRELRKEIEKLGKQASTSAMVEVEEEKSPWERFNDNLRDTPILRSIYGFADSDVAKKARDAAEDAREALETSQNPLVYRMYSVYDNMFGETEMGEAIKEFRRLDPEFTMETFQEEMQEDLIPTVIRAFLAGDLSTIERFCSEGAGAAVKASIRERIDAGRKMDEHILSIGDLHIATAKVVDKIGPTIVIQFMVQQINCLYDLKGNVVEGKEDEIVGVFYIFALTLESHETTGELSWKIKEFAIGGTTPYI